MSLYWSVGPVGRRVPGRPARFGGLRRVPLGAAGRGAERGARRHGRRSPARRLPPPRTAAVRRGHASWRTGRENRRLQPLVARRTLTVVAKASGASGSWQSPPRSVPLWYEVSHDCPASRSAGDPRTSEYRSVLVRSGHVRAARLQGLRAPRPSRRPSPRVRQTHRHPSRALARAFPIVTDRVGPPQSPATAGRARAEVVRVPSSGNAIRRGMPLAGAEPDIPHTAGEQPADPQSGVGQHRRGSTAAFPTRPEGHRAVPYRRRTPGPERSRTPPQPTPANPDHTAHVHTSHAHTRARSPIDLGPLDRKVTNVTLPDPPGRPPPHDTRPHHPRPPHGDPPRVDMVPSPLSGGATEAPASTAAARPGHRAKGAPHPTPPRPSGDWRPHPGPRVDRAQPPRTSSRPTTR